jgi:hypothetical protein
MIDSINEISWLAWPKSMREKRSVRARVRALHPLAPADARLVVDAHVC